MDYDVIIIGAGPSGMMCAIHAGQRGRRILLVDHSAKAGGKIPISGGGHCNFTNRSVGPGQYVSRNPHFCKSALTRFPSDGFIQMLTEHGIAFHERKWGQLFCDGSAQEIVTMLQGECAQAGARFELQCRIERVSRLPETGKERFQIETSAGVFRSESLVIATGGLSLPRHGATGLGYGIARQFGLKVVETAPALDGFVFIDAETRVFRELAGISLDCTVSCNGLSFRENILFTHSGLSGPAALQASLHWKPGDPIYIDLLPEPLPDGLGCFEWFLRKKKEGNRSVVKNLLGELLPCRFAERFCDRYFPIQLPLPQVSEKALETFCAQLRAWKIVPGGTVGFSKAEVTRGGVDTDELSSKTMEAKKVPGLYFIGEVVDVTGWLGGYNFQWAWSSGWAAGQVV